MAYSQNGGWYPVLPDSPQPTGGTYGRLLSGDGPPSNDDGENGYAWINTTTGDLYVKYGDTWNIVQGAAGGSGESGIGSPEGVVASPPGTSYVDTSNGEFYFKVEGVGNTGWFGPYIENPEPVT